MIELYLSTVKILAQSPTHISSVATEIPITKTFTIKNYILRQKAIDKYSISRKK